MKRVLFSLFICFVSFLPITAALPDSIAGRMVELAMRGDLRTLRPLYAHYRDSLPVMYRLACDLTIADDDSDDARLVACIDSLTRFYSKNIPAGNRSVWNVKKAAALCRLGRYPEAAAFCKKELRRMGRRKNSSQAELLAHYRDKALRYADTVSLRGRLLGLADRGDADGIIRLCAVSDTASLDGYARHRIRLLLGDALGRPALATDAARQLFDHYPDSLDADGAQATFAIAAHALAYEGRWDSLGRLCDFYGENADDADPLLTRYSRLSHALAGCPASRVERPTGDAFALTSYDWPLTTDIRVNGHTLSATVVDTGSPFTLLSHADALACGVRLLADTVETGSAFGLVKACTGYVDEVTIGGIRIKNIVVLVRLDGPSSPGTPLTNLLGLNELRRIGHVVFRNDRLVFPAPALAAPAVRPDTTATVPDFYFHAQGLRLPALHDGRRHVFGLDTGAAAQVLSAAAFPPASTDTARFVLHLAGNDVRLPYVTLAGGRSPDYDGLLGMGFVRCFREFGLDFGALRLSLSHPIAPSRQHRTAADWINRSDWFGLERNAASLAKLQSPEERDLTHLFVAFGKNRPDTVVALATRLLSSPGYDRSARFTFVLQKEHSLEELGRYGEAAALLRHADSLGLVATDFEALLPERTAYLDALSGEMPPSLILSATTSVSADAGGTWPAFVNGRATRALVDPATYRASMSEKQARRMKVRIVLKRYTEDGERVKVGIVDSLRLGNAVMRHLVVDLVKDKEAPLRLGLDFLRHAGEVVFTAGRLTLSPSGNLSPDVASVPLRLSGGRLAIPDVADVAAPYDAQGLRSSDGAPLLPAFLEQTGSLTLDFQHMRAK